MPKNSEPENIGWGPRDSPPGWTCPDCGRELGGHRHKCNCGFLVTDL